MYICSMKTLLRTVLHLALIVWLGAEIFFPIVAAVTFATLRPDTHAAGAIVGHLLRILHGMGYSCGMIAVLMLAVGATRRFFHPRAVLMPIALLAVMIGLTLYSQLGIIPAMERDRIAVGGVIEAADDANPSRMDFEWLHRHSVYVEGSVLLLGLATVALVVRAESKSL
jgi:hypothetical protein